jgi:hypothetical protein
VASTVWASRSCRRGRESSINLLGGHPGCACPELKKSCKKLYTIKDECDLAKYECDPNDHDKWSETMTPCYAAMKQQLVPDRQANGGKHSGDW